MKLTRMGLLVLGMALAVQACSTNGGMYKENDPVNGDFSVWRSLALPFAVIGVAAVGAAAGAAAVTPEPVYYYRRPVHCTTSRIGRSLYTNCY